MGTIVDATWSDINALRDRLMARVSRSVARAAQSFAEDLSGTFSSVALARVFLVLPMSRLPEPERDWATALAGPDIHVPVQTSVLSLIGTSGREAAWCDRLRSRGHRAIPLLSKTFVQGAPMIAKLLADLEVDLAALDDGRPIATRRMLGGKNGMFYVPDAKASCDAEGRHIIPGRDFVSAHDVRTVFGMGGAYADGTLAVVIVFTSELLASPIVDRFSSLISNFKMATTDLHLTNRIFEGAA